MERKQVRCRSCGAPMMYEPGMTRMKCASCGAEYLLRPSAAEQTVFNVTDGVGCLFRTFIPPQWQARTGVNSELFSMDVPVCMDLILTSPGNSMLIMNPFAYYRDSRPPVMAAPGDEQLDLALVRHLCRRPMEDYLVYKIGRLLPAVRITACKRCAEEEESLANRAKGFSAEARRKLKGDVDLSWGCYELQLADGSGQTQTALFSTVQAAKRETPRPEPKREPQTTPRQGGFGAALKGFLDYGMSGGLLGHMGGTSGSTGSQTPNIFGSLAKSGSDWGTLFDVLLLYREGPISDAHVLMDRFIRHIQYGARYDQLQREEADRVTRIMIQGQQQRQQIAFNGWQRVHQTQAETSDIINRGYAQRQATMDRVYDRVSEGVRGVNTYETTDGRRVEADVRYDHLYQNGSLFVGTVDGSISPGPDWVEIKKT